MTESRDQILADALRLEDAEQDARKGLWVIENDADPAVCVIVEAVTAPGATAVAHTLSLLPEGKLRIGGPVDRRAWPSSYWYRLLTPADVDQMEKELLNGDDDAH